MHNISLLNLFFIFTKVGAILLGGGYVILPILINEFVEKRKLVDREELINYFAISQSLPGIIAANISMFIGYKLRGKLGALTAMLGIVFIPFFTIILLASILVELTNNEYVKEAMWGIGIAVIALIILTVREMWQNSNKDLFFYSIFTLALLALLYLGLSPIKTILLFSFFGVLHKRFSTPKEAR